MKAALDRPAEAPLAKERSGHRPRSRQQVETAAEFAEVLADKTGLHAEHQSRRDPMQDKVMPGGPLANAMPFAGATTAFPLQFADQALEKIGRYGGFASPHEPKAGEPGARQFHAARPERRETIPPSNDDVFRKTSRERAPADTIASLVRTLHVENDSGSSSAIRPEPEAAKPKPPMGDSESFAPREELRDIVAVPPAPLTAPSEMRDLPSPARQILSHIRSLATDMVRETAEVLQAPAARALQMRLQPANLGDVHVTLRITGGVLAVVVRPSASETATALSQDAAALEEILSQIAGLSAASVTVVSSAASADQAALQHQGDSQAGASLSQGRGHHGQPTGAHHHDEPEPPAPKVGPAPLHRGSAGDERVV